MQTSAWRKGNTSFCFSFTSLLLSRHRQKCFFFYLFNFSIRQRQNSSCSTLKVQSDLIWFLIGQFTPFLLYLHFNFKAVRSTLLLLNSKTIYVFVVFLGEFGHILRNIFTNVKCWIILQICFSTWLNQRIYVTTYRHISIYLHFSASESVAIMLIVLTVEEFWESKDCHRWS